MMQQFIIVPYPNFVLVKENGWIVEGSALASLTGFDPLTGQPSLLILTVNPELTDEQKSEIPYPLRSLSYIKAWRNQTREYFNLEEE